MTMGLPDQQARRPEAAAPARIAELATLPLFWKLRGKRVLLVGDTEGALWKAELLLAAGARLLVIAGHEENEALAALAAGHGDHIEIARRVWTPVDFDGAAMAIGDIEGEDEAAAFVATAKSAGVPVNVIDKPAFCEFQFGAIVNRSPLIVSISTDGAAPVFGQAIRARIEALLPPGLKGWAEAARDWRGAVQAHALPYAGRRRFWERFTALALRDTNRPPVHDDRDGLLATIDSDASAGARGQVTLVGAGPGDPELLTLKAVRALQAADIILFDDLVAPEILELARREALRVLVGKTGYGPSCTQGDVSALMVKLAIQGKRVVRLKSGDPLVFGRATEEIRACHEAGIPVSIVPGISAAQGAAASLGISLTERVRARRVQFLTGHAHDGALPTDIAWEALADPSVTTVVYMPRRTLGQLRDRVLAAGLDPATPALAVIAATRPDEQRVAGTISTLPDLLDTVEVRGPVLVIIGRVLDDVEEIVSRAETGIDPSASRVA
jgi:uroporphyrin-III C-methyltransferase / precorrin-2 dehydrogenase / sirohydrochlorin ferrochelatase